MVLADGKTLDPHMYDGEKSLSSSRATQMEINQAYPNKLSWRAWRKAMKLWTSARKLDKLLGR
eukprot:12555051-Ditylum_brightwellii.AAC.1